MRIAHGGGTARPVIRPDISHTGNNTSQTRNDIEALALAAINASARTCNFDERLLHPCPMPTPRDNIVVPRQFVRNLTVHAHVCTLDSLLNRSLHAFQLSNPFPFRFYICPKIHIYPFIVLALGCCYCYYLSIQSCYCNKEYLYICSLQFKAMSN